MSQIVGTACRIASASNQHLSKTAGHTALMRAAVQTQQVIPGLENGDHNTEHSDNGTIQKQTYYCRFLNSIQLFKWLVPENVHHSDHHVIPSGDLILGPKPLSLLEFET